MADCDSFVLQERVRAQRQLVRSRTQCMAAPCLVTRLVDLCRRAPRLRQDLLREHLHAPAVGFVGRRAALPALVGVEPAGVVLALAIEMRPPRWRPSPLSTP